MLPRSVFFFIWGVSLTHPVLGSFLSGEFLLHVPCWLHFYLGSLSYTSRADFLFCLVSFSYTSRAGFIFIWGLSLTHPVQLSFLSREFLLHIPCWFLLFFHLGSFSYTSCAGFLLLLFSFSFFHLGSFSHTSCAGFIFLWGVSLTHPMLTLFFLREFLLHIPCGLLFYFFQLGVSLTHPVLASFLSREFVSNIRCCLFLFFIYGEFLLHIQCWLYFYLGSFSYTSHACLIFLWGVSLTHPMILSGFVSLFCFCLICFCF